MSAIGSLLTPVEESFIRAVERINLLADVRAQADRVAHFERRMVERGLDAREWVIVVLEVDDPSGRTIADLLMPGTDWEAIRARDGGPPYARGFAQREAMQEILVAAGSEGARELAELDGVVVLAVGRGVAAAFRTSEVTS